MLEVRKHLKSKNSATCSIVHRKLNNSNVHNRLDSAIPGCSSSNDNPIPSYNCHIVHETNIINDGSSSSSSSCASEVSETFFENFCQPSFRERLASCFVDNNLTHIQGNSLLSLLRTHPCFSNLPKDVRTLLNTPRNSAVVSKSRARGIHSLRFGSRFN